MVNRNLRPWCRTHSIYYELVLLPNGVCFNECPACSREDYDMEKYKQKHPDWRERLAKLLRTP